MLHVSALSQSVEIWLPQAVPLGAFVYTQPLVATQESVVQGLLSLQLSAVPAAQAPFWHVSAPLQTLPSLHDVPLAFAVCVQVPAPLHTSLVQALPSSVQAVPLNS